MSISRHNCYIFKAHAEAKEAICTLREEALPGGQGLPD